MAVALSIGGALLGFEPPSRRLGGPVIRDTRFGLGQLCAESRNAQASRVLDLPCATPRQDAAALRLCEQGCMKYQQGRHDEALVDLDSALALRPREGLALRARGLVRSQLGQLWGALADLDAALELRPDDVLALCERGSVRGRLGLRAAASADLDRAMELAHCDLPRCEHDLACNDACEGLEGPLNDLVVESEAPTTASSTSVAAATPAAFTPLRVAEDEGSDCAICAALPANQVFVPCGHLATCGDCGPKFLRRPCPLCCTTVELVQRVYRA